MSWSRYAFYGAAGFFCLLLALYSWQSKRGFQEWSRWDSSCRNSSSSLVRGFWACLLPLLHCGAVLFRTILRAVAAVWAALYRVLDSLGSRCCPDFWEQTKRCGAHTLGSCWYASATAVVQIDNSIAESEQVSRLNKGRSPKILRKRAEELKATAKELKLAGGVVPRAERGTVENPSEAMRSYSSVTASGGALTNQSMLFAAGVWSPKHNAVGEWLELDLGSDKLVMGIVTQGRSGSTQRATRFSVQYRMESGTSLKGARWLSVPEEFAAQGLEEGCIKSLFDTCVVARHLRITVLEWRECVALRAGALLASDDIWGAGEILKASTRYVDGWQAPFKALRQVICEEVCRQMCELLKEEPNLDEETKEFRSRTEVNLGKENNDKSLFTRVGIFSNTGQMETLASLMSFMEDIGSKVSNPVFKPAGPLLEKAVLDRIRWASKNKSDYKAVQYALLCASALQQLHLSDVKEAAKHYHQDLRRLPQDWDILGMLRENAYGYRIIQKVKIQGCMLGAPPLPGTFAATLQSLLDESYISKVTRDRRDGKSVPHRLVLVSACEVQNEQSWVEYAQRREQIRAELRSEPLEQVQTFGTAMPPPILVRSADVSRLPKLDQETQEVWLFHGTTAAGAEGITSEDFRVSLAGSAAGTLYGRGIYLAEACTKSDEYTKEEQLGTDRYLLLCRATLGRVYYTDKTYNDANQLEDMCKTGSYHCVLGDREKARGTFREFIVYDDDQVYAAYILCYRRQSYNWREGGK